MGFVNRSTMTIRLPFPTSDRILHQYEGEFTHYEGLPVFDPRDKTITLVTDGTPSLSLFKRLYVEAGKTHFIFPYSMHELLGYRTFLPSTYHKIAASLDQSLPPAVGLKAQVLQARTELHTKVSTIDSAVINGRRDLRTTVSKVRQCLRLHGLLMPLGAKMPHAREFGPYTEERQEDILLEVKMRLMRLYENIEWPFTAVPQRELKADINDDDRKKFGYIGHYRRLLGDNLTGIVAYGSSTRSDDPASYGDFDNWFIVHDIPAAYALLRNTKPHLHTTTGDVVTIDEELAKKDPAYKHIGILLLPHNSKVRNQYLRALHDIDEFAQTIRVLYGSVSLSVLSPAETVEQGIVQAYVKAKTLVGAVMTNEDQMNMTKKPALYDYFRKNSRFFFKHAIKRVHSGLMTKEEADAKMKERFGIEIAPSGDDWETLHQGILYTRLAAAHMQKELLSDVAFDGSYIR